MSAIKTSFEDALKEAFHYEKGRSQKNLEKEANKKVTDKKLEIHKNVSIEQSNIQWHKNIQSKSEVSQTLSQEMTMIKKSNKELPKCISIKACDRKIIQSSCKSLKKDKDKSNQKQVTVGQNSSSSVNAYKKPSQICSMHIYKGNRIVNKVENSIAKILSNKHLNGFTNNARGHLPKPSTQQISTPKLRKNIETKSQLSSTGRIMDSVLHTLQSWQQPTHMNISKKFHENNSLNRPVVPKLGNTKEMTSAVTATSNHYSQSKPIQCKANKEMSTLNDKCDKVTERFIRFKGIDYKIIQPVNRGTGSNSRKKEPEIIESHFDNSSKNQLASVFSVSDPYLSPYGTNPVFGSNESFNFSHQGPSSGNETKHFYLNKHEIQDRDPLETHDMLRNCNSSRTLNVLSDKMVQNSIFQNQEIKKRKRKINKTSFPKPKKSKRKQCLKVDTSKKKRKKEHKIVKLVSLANKPKDRLTQGKAKNNITQNHAQSQNSFSNNCDIASKILDKKLEITISSKNLHFGNSQLPKATEIRDHDLTDHIKLCKDSEENDSMPFIQRQSDYSKLIEQPTQAVLLAKNGKSHSIHQSITLNENRKMFSVKRQNPYYELLRLDVYKHVKLIRINLKRISSLKELIDKDLSSNGKESRCRICSYRARMKKIRAHVEQNHAAFVMNESVQSSRRKKEQCKMKPLNTKPIYVRYYQQDIIDVVIQPIISDTINGAIKQSFMRDLIKKSTIQPIIKRILNQTFNYLLNKERRREKITKFVIKPTISRIFNETIRIIRHKIKLQVTNVKKNENQIYESPEKNIVYKIIVSIQCSYCKICFSNRYRLREHMQNAHHQGLVKHISDQERKFADISSNLLQYYCYRE